MSFCHRSVIAAAWGAICQRWVLCAACLTLSLTLSPTAWADPVVQLNANSDTVEQGDAIQVQLSASGSDEAPSNPRLTAPPGFVIVGPSVGTSQQISINGNGIQRSVGLTATWRVSATKMGEFVIGPATVAIDGTVFRSNPITVRVVAKDSLPKRRPRRGPQSLFDDDFFQGFGRPGRSLFEDLVQQQEPPPQEVPSEYQLETAADPYAFLRATVTPQNAVVGQQVTFRVYAYGALGRFNENNSREARKADFYSVPLSDPSRPSAMYRMAIGGRDYVVTKIRDVALFPLKAGKLEVGPMSISFYGSRYVSNAHPEGLERSTQSLFVDVQEPPSAGRPLGYQVGNVGRFELSASVSPREISAGNSISVVATLRGQGQLPARLNTPDQHDVEWLEPSIQEQIKPDETGRLAGTRTLTYVVKLKQPGNINLGTLSLDYYDPNTGAYATAKVELGEIAVAPESNPSAHAGPKGGTKEHSLLEHTSAQTKLTASPPKPNFIADARWFWWLLGALPVLSIALQAGADRYQRFRSERHTKSTSPAYIAQESLKDAAAEMARGEHATAISHLERAVFSALDASSGLKSRGFIRAELRKALQEKQFSEELADSSVALLGDLEEARFAFAGDATPLLEQTRSLVRKVLSRAT